MKKTKKSEIERALESGDTAKVDAILAANERQHDKEREDAIARGLRVGRLEDQYREDCKKIAESMDYSLPEYNGDLGAHRLAECRNALGLTQAELANTAKVDQQIISMAENGKFFGPSRDKIWKKIFMLQCEQHITETKGRTYSGDTLKDFAQIMQPLMNSLGFGKTPLERKDEEIRLKDEEIRLLKEQNECYRKEAEFSRQLLDMDLVNRCVELEKQLAAALTANAEYAKLFALKGAAVAGEELQEQIEAKLKKGSQ